MGLLTLMTYNVFSGRTLDGCYDLSGKIETIRTASPDNPVLAPLFKCFCDTAEGLGKSETLTFRFFIKVFIILKLPDVII